MSLENKLADNLIEGICNTTQKLLKRELSKKEAYEFAIKYISDMSSNIDNLLKGEHAQTGMYKITNVWLDFSVSFRAKLVDLAVEYAMENDLKKSKKDLMGFAMAIEVTSHKGKIDSWEWLADKDLYWAGEKNPPMCFLGPLNPTGIIRIIKIDNDLFYQTSDERFNVVPEEKREYFEEKFRECQEKYLKKSI